jgi:hypothetical protein
MSRLDPRHPQSRKFQDMVRGQFSWGLSGGKGFLPEEETRRTVELSSRSMPLSPRRLWKTWFSVVLSSPLKVSSKRMTFLRL